VEKETVDIFALGVHSVGTTAGQIVPIPVAGGGEKGVLFKAPGALDDTPNTVAVFIGRSNVTADQTGSGGFPLAPGDSITLPVDAANEWYAIATATSQVINWINL
jgi:hypothetical protein